MEPATPILDSEPTRLVASLLGFAAAVNGLLTLTEVYNEKIGGALMIVVAAAVSLGGELVRSRVWSRKSVDALITGQPEPPYDQDK
jgi:hypothetical protein